MPNEDFSMSDVFPVPIAQSQLDQFKKQANILGEEIHAIIGGKVLRGNRALNLYAVACGYNSYNAVVNASKGHCLAKNESEVLWILSKSHAVTMADNINRYSPMITNLQAQEALINLRKRNTIAHQATGGMLRTILGDNFSISDDSLKEIRKNTNKEVTLEILTGSNVGTSEAFDVLCDVPAYESYHKDPEWARKTEQGMLELAKKHGRDNDLLLMNSNRGKAMDIEPYDGKVDYEKLASFSYRSAEPKSFYQNYLFNEDPISQPPKIHQIDIGQSMINGIKNRSSAIGVKRVSHNSIVSGNSVPVDLNPIVNASSQQITDLLLSITQKSLSSSDYALFEMTIKKLLSNNPSSTLLDCANTIEQYPPFKSIAKELKENYLGQSKYGHVFEEPVGEININNAIISEENTGKSYYSEHTKHEVKESESLITQDNIADYLSLLDKHIPELKQEGMPDSNIPYHMMHFYDVPILLTLKQLSKSK
jgi:hypothetical protein